MLIPLHSPFPLRLPAIIRRWTTLRPSRPLSDIWSRRNALILLGLGASLFLGAGIVWGADDLPTCPMSASILSYPRYSRKGLIEKYTYRCGQPDRTCRLREYTAKGPVLVCSPFSLSAK